MKTQTEDLRNDIRILKVRLKHASIHSDIFTTIELYKQLEIKKSILINIQ